jgi:multiple sugar transport system substrate-binding protein
MERDVIISRRRFLGSLAAVGVVVACGQTVAPSPSASASASAAPATAKPVSIEWWRRNYTPGSQNAETVASDAAVKGWKERNPNFTITIQGGPFGPETDQKFDIAILQQKAGPDVFHTTGGDVLKYAAAGQLSEPPLTDAERRDFNPSALQATTYKGKVVAYPLWIVPWFEYINLDLFKEAGVTPPKDGNWTYDEFFAAAKKLTFKRSNGKQAYGFAHANDEFAFMLIDGGRPYDKDVKTWTFNSADAVSGLEKWVALAQAKVMPPDFLTLNPNDAQARFLSGDIAILQRPSAMINVLNADKNWEFGKNWDIANFPRAKGDQTAWGGVGFIAVREQQDADKKAAAHQFAKYLTGPDIGPDLKKQTPPVEYWLAPAGRTSAAGIYGDYHPAKAKVAKMGAFTYVLPNVSTWSEIDQKYMRPARDAALEGKKTPKQALDEVTPAAQRLLDEANK